MRSVLVATALAVVLGLAPVAEGQHPTTGSLAGRVVDVRGAPVAQAMVILSSSRGTSETATEASGRFLLPYLTPGRYAVRVEKPGYRTAERREVEVRLGARSELTVTLAAAAFSGTVEITAAAPLLDPTSTEVGRTVGAAELERLPVGRRLADAMYLAPAAASSGGAGRPNPSFAGASGLENQYVVDGINVTDSRYGALGVYSSEYGPLGSAVTTEFVDEVRVRSAGAAAADEQSTGGLVTVVTRSGTNDLAGSAFAYAAPSGLEADRRRLELADGAVNTVATSTSELGFSLGGALVRDRAFYFLAASRQIDRTTYVAPDGFPLSFLGEVDRDRTALAYAGKLTLQPGPRHRVEVTAFGDPTDADTGPQAHEAMRFRTTGAFSALEYGGSNQGLHYQGIAAKGWLFEASLGRAASRFEETTLVDEWLVTDETVTPAVVSGGKGRYESRNDGESLQLRASSTYLAGRHEVRWGVSAEEVRSDSVRDITGPRVVLADGRRTTSGAIVTVLPDSVHGSIWRVTRAELESGRSATSTSLGLFAQDRITLGSGLSVSLGIRAERQRIEGDAASFTFDDNWAPRAGVVWDPGGRGRTKVYGSLGVFFARLPNSLAMSMFSSSGRVRRADYFDAALTDPVPEGVDAAGTTRHLILSGTEPAAVDPSAELTRTRELSLGVEHAVGRHVVVGLHVHHRDMPTVLEDVNTSAVVLYYRDDDTVEYLLTNPREGYPATVDDVGAFVDPVHRFDAVTLTAERRFADGWSLLASYRWSRLRGNYEGFYRNDTEQSQPAITAIFDFPPDDPSYVGIGVPQYGFRGDIRHLADSGPLPNDRTHQVRLFGSWRHEGGFTLGAAVVAGSGRPLTPMAANPVYDRAGEIPEAPRGDGIETEDGFAARTPFEWTVDLHAGYSLPLAWGRLELLLDVFNLFDHQGVVDYDQNTEVGFGVPNPDFGRRTAYQPPRTVRLGARFEL